MSSAQTIPTNLVYSALLFGLRDCPELTALVGVRSFIRYDGTEDDPELDNATEGDLPEIMVQQTGFVSNARSSSSSFSVTMQYAIQIRTEHLRQAATDGINAVAWWVFVALERMRQKSRPPGMEFVKNVTYGPTRVSAQGPEQDGAPPNWAAVLTVSYECHFPLAAWIDRGTA